jgi:hypothetical protein
VTSSRQFEFSSEIDTCNKVKGLDTHGGSNKQYCRPLSRLCREAKCRQLEQRETQLCVSHSVAAQTSISVWRKPQGVLYLHEIKLQQESHKHGILYGFELF